MDLKRTIIILMVLACIVNMVGVIHCHINYSYNSTISVYRITYSILFPICKWKRFGICNKKIDFLFYSNIVFSVTVFILIEQLLITDGTAAPLNRFRGIYAFVAAITLFIFGIGTSIVSSRWYDSADHNAYEHSKIILNLIFN